MNNWGSLNLVSLLLHGLRLWALTEIKQGHAKARCFVQWALAIRILQVHLGACFSKLEHEDSRWELCCTQEAEPCWHSSPSHVCFLKQEDTANLQVAIRGREVQGRPLFRGAGGVSCGAPLQEELHGFLLALL